MEITISNLQFRYKQSDPLTLNRMTLEVKSHERIAIIGRSGSGKSTLLRMINGLLRPDSGQVILNDTALDYSKLNEIRRGIGYVMQEGGLFPHLTAKENITLMARVDRWPQTRKDDRLQEVLRLVNLKDGGLLDRRPRQLSGGQRQRVAIARALFLDPPVILLDEPFAHLDTLVRKDLTDEFLSLEEKVRKTVVLVTHDLQVAYRVADRICLISNGTIEQDSTTAEFVKNPKTELAKAFVDAMFLRTPE
jgi:osmoprotectant transport system ATP-binding protein